MESNEINLNKIDIRNKFSQLLSKIKKEKNQNGPFFNIENSDNKNIDLYTNLNGNFKDYYKNLYILGEGTMGLVKKTMCQKTNKFFAVKIIRSRDEEIINQIIEEFKNIKKLNHNNIIKVKSLFIDKLKGKIYLIMEHFDSIELFNYICTMGNYTEIIAKKLFKQLLEGIRYLHSEGIIHRDLKPHNLLVSKDDNLLKITDFNIAKFFNNKNNYDKLKKDNYKMLTFTGTLSFNAPEKFNKNLYTEVIDCWSAGCVLYTMLIGKQPFYKDKLDELIYQIKNCDYDTKCIEWLNLSQQAKSLITDLLEIIPEKRLTPKEALNHGWFSSNTNSDLSYWIEKIYNNKKLNKYNTLKDSKFSEIKNNKLYYSESLKDSDLNIEFWKKN